MYIINDKGELVEGQELTAEEVRLIPTLVEEINANAAGVYIAERYCKEVVRYLIGKYRITERRPPPPEDLRDFRDQINAPPLPYVPAPADADDGPLF